MPSTGSLLETYDMMSSNNKSTGQRCTVPECSKNDNSPVRTADNVTVRSTKRQALSSPPNVETSPLTREEAQTIMENILKEHLANLLHQLTTKMHTILDTELRQLKNELQDVKQSMQFVNDQFEEIVKEHKTSQTYVKQLQDENTKMLSTITDLKTRVNQLEQNARCKNVEIQCVPEKKNRIFNIYCEGIR